MSWKRTALAALALTLILTLWFAAGFVIAVFSTNPPPPVPGAENMIAFGRYCLFGIISLLFGIVAGILIARAASPKGSV
jgi:purine-cytosine permease-like protein